MTPSRDFKDLLALMHRLRQECAWDKKQTNTSLQKYAIEEVFELIEAINLDDKSDRATDDIKGELGDVLLQVVFHAEIYQENQRFDMGDVIYHLMEKLIRRHPHVFDKENLLTDEDVKRRWDEIKAIENKDRPQRLLSDVKAGTALMTAQNLQKQAGKVGFDWDKLSDVLDKVKEELGELCDEVPDNFCHKTDKLNDAQKAKIAGELGDVLFAVTNMARHLGVDAETALQQTNAKFQRRFAFVEESLLEAGKSFEESDLAEMDRYWELAKRHESTQK